MASIAQPQQHADRVNPSIEKRTCNWYLPVFDSAFYGGVLTILRLAAHLKERDGITHRFLICGQCSPRDISEKISSAFASLRDVEVTALDSADALNTIPASDYSVATLWTTAYVLLKVQNTGYKFYMIQDYEPLFYPAGSTYAQAELTYRFGFLGIANTVSIKEIYQKDYGGRAVVLTPCIDSSIFHPAPDLPSDGVKRLFYYARPRVPRNGFELAAAAFRLLKSRMGESVEILCAGADWNPSHYGLGGVVSTVGMLPYKETGSLYRSCHVGLGMMMTKHPSYMPFELMACGVLVVSNFNPANTWLLKDRENCLLSAPTATCLAETLYEALNSYSALKSVRAAAASTIRESHSNWARSMHEVAVFMHTPFRE